MKLCFHLAVPPGNGGWTSLCLTMVPLATGCPVLQPAWLRRSAGMAICEPQHGQGTVEPNEGIKLPHPILHEARAMEEEHNAS